MKYVINKQPSQPRKINGLKTSRYRKSDYRELGKCAHIFLPLESRASEINQNGRKTETVYDLQGRVTSVKTSEGTVSYEYDKFGRQTRVYSDKGDNVKYEYDILGRLSTVTDANTGIVTKYEYDLVGNLAKTTTQINRDTKLVETYKYNNMNRLIELTNYVDKNNNGKMDEGEGVSQFAYTLDAQGKKTRANETFWIDGTAKENQIDWQYDNAGRLIMEAFDHYNDELDQTLRFEYDLVGNRLSQTVDKYNDNTIDQAFAYFYDANDRLIDEWFDGQNDGEFEKKTRYGYDHTQQTLKTVTENGLVTTKTNFEYNLQGRMSVVTVSTYGEDGTTIIKQERTTYEYGENGIRTSASHEVAGEDGVFHIVTKTEYLNDSRSITGYSQVLRQTEYDADGNIVKETSYIIGHQRISQTVKINGEETTLFFTFDGHGSTRVLLEAAGAIAQLFAFDAYGNAIGFNPAEAKTEFLYSGEQFDAKIGQQYLRARYYDPATGRFNRLDPFFGTMYDPQSFHKYLYTHDDPINSIDPTGKMSMVMSIGIGMAIGGVTGGAIGGIYATLRGLKGEHFWSTVRTGALIGAGGAFAYMAPIATLMAVTGSQSLSALALPILVAYNQLSSVPNKHLLGVILFFRWWGFASAPQINIPLQFFWKEYGNPNDESDASWLRHLNDVLFDDILTQPKYTEARNNIINEMTNKPVGTSMSNQNPIEINIYGDRGPLAWIIGGMELSYTATKTASGITIKWKLFDEVDAKSFMENYKDGQFNKNSSSEAWLIGTIEGLADILFDKLGQAWYPLSVYKTETIR